MAKAVAGREKDAIYVLSLIKSGILDVEILFERLKQMPPDVSPEMINMVGGYLADLRSTTDKLIDRGPCGS